tara:strand:+ start:201 stop:869 length:669 start_codon:yes stop_codon:yes gene_type:complete
MLKSDFHLHSSEDPKDNIKYSSKELINYCSKLGYEVLALTHHGTRFFNNEIFEYAKSKNILLIPGVEANINNKHTLIINAPEGYDYENLTFEELVNIKSQHKVIIIAAHPFYPRHNCLGNNLVQNIELFDGIEYCHLYKPYINWFNKKAVTVAKKFNKSVIGTSDAHSLSQIGYTYTLLDCEKNKEAVLDALKNNKLKLSSKPLPWKTFFKVSWEAVKSLFE